MSHIYTKINLRFLTCSSSVYVMFSLTPKGQLMYSVSLCNVNINTIKTKSALNMEKKKTALFLSSFKPAAILS